MLPFLAKGKDGQGVTSLIAVRNNSNCNDIELKLEVRKGTGTVVSYVHVFSLAAGHVKLIDLANVGSVNPGFVGAGTVRVLDVEQLCDGDNDGHMDQAPTMLSVVVVNKGEGPGDITAVYEGIPSDHHGSSCLVTVSGQVIDELTLDPIEGADVNGVATGSWGHYEFQVPSSTWGTAFTLDVAKPGYYAWSQNYTLYCDDLVVNPELYPVCDTVGVAGYVEDKMTGLPIAGANVLAANCQDSDSTVTGANGYYSMKLDYDDDCITWVMAGADGYNGSSDSVFIPICDTALITFQLHQTPKSRVLLYYGNGGVGAPTGDPIAFTKLAELFEDLGYIVDYQGTWPTEFDWTLKYELIVLLGPGHDNEDLGVNGFTIGQKADLDEYLQQNGKLAILSDAASFTGVGVENDLLTTLPVTLRFDAANYSSGHGDQIMAHCLTTNVQVYSTLDGADNWTSVQATVLGAAPGDLIKQNASSGQGPNEEMYAVDVPSHGNGWVAILGDMHGLSDVGWMSNMNWSADNEWIPVNWIGCAP